MEKLLGQVLDELRSAWRFRWWALLAAGLVAVAGWIAVFSLQDRFEATSRVFVDTRTALKPVVQGLTIEQDTNAQLNFVRQSLLTGPQLKSIAEESGVLSPTLRDPAAQSRVLQNMAKSITITVRSAGESERDRDAGSIYSLVYQDGNRERALRVIEVLQNTLVEQTLGGKREGAETAQKFLEESIKEYERRLRVAEDRLAQFKSENIGLMPTDQGGYFAQLQAEIDAVRKAETSLSIAESRRAELLRQMRGEAVITAAGVPVVGANGAVAGGDTVSRIKEAQARLDELLLRFTEKHPDVIATRQTLDELKKRRTAEIESLRRGDAGAVVNSGAGASPVFQSIQLALNQAEVEIASLRGELQQHRAKAAELKQRLDTAPKVEAEFAQLNRDYDINKAQYTALLANYEKARLGEQADNAGSVRFEIVQPPTASFAPVFPRRGFFLIAVLVAALGTGGALAYLLHLLKPVVGSARSLATLTGLTVLGVVAPAFPGRISAQRRKDLLQFSAGLACLIGAFFVVVLLNWSGFRLGSSGGPG
jgi:polysaccharide chain length determinant protein (PEP-CTERM system associated)